MLGYGTPAPTWRSESRLSRRQFLRRTSLASTGLLAARCLGPLAAPVRADTESQQFTIRRIDRVTVQMPFREVPQRAMDRELPHWRYLEVFQVELASGKTGVGETLLYYTWGATGDAEVDRALGQNAAALMWDDSLGAGLQIALFDAVAQTAGVPLHRLLGRQQHQRTPLSWWNIDMPPEDMAQECATAHQRGYTSYKTKGRPWFDLWDQVAAVARIVPESFQLDMDFNETLRDANRAIPILKDLEADPRIAIYETPIPQGNVVDNQRIRKATRVAIAMHYGSPPPAIAIGQQVCDGFVVGGGASRVLQQAAVAAMADLPFWLQLVGSGITAAFSLHLGAVCRRATWPAVNCHQLYQCDLLTQPIRVTQGLADVPQTPGLGFELDRDAVERFRVDKPASRPDPPRLLETSWPDGRRLYVASNNQVNFLLNAANRGQIPFYKRGATTCLVPDDGSPVWRDRYDRACLSPFYE